MDWKYVKELKAPELITEFEESKGYVFQQEYVQCVLKNNGARPSKRVFKVLGAEKEIKTFLSFNKEDRETMWVFNENNNRQDKYITFAIDNFGNLICFKKNDGSVCFANHETGTVKRVADSFTDFLNSLYTP